MRKWRGLMPIERVNLKNRTSVPMQPEIGLFPGEGVLVQPTGAGKECLAQKRREDMVEALQKLSSEPRS